MRPRTFVLLIGFTLGGLTLGTPLFAQTGHPQAGGWLSIGQQYPPYSQPAPYPQRPGAAPYPGQRGNGRGYGYGDGYGYDDYARSTGYRDGYEKGLDAARDRDRFDPRRERWYRSGDRGYMRDARMSRDQYKDIYRRGFVSGYEAGYRDGQYGYRGYGQQPRGGYPGYGGYGPNRW